ncbi:Fe-S protein assembly co-chaperone HscB [Xylophilus sp. ASV27]|uniref:Fe-S protein assembly co-chaperone HscB n=1 Tax=Xylophilus sp. ASV27 TaxID=2795129 RepID=UPI0018ED67AA|nr:Fe-S protein assembly co-chaperone HscB [Xylophilus sp. ASV27]
MNLHDTDFDLFAVPATFAQDRAVLDARWKELQRQAHPDRFAAQGGAAQRMALQWSVRINEAYRRLRDPLQRAAYLCELRGAPIEAESNTAMPAEFLMRQMEWREALEDAVDAADIERLRQEVDTARAAALQRCAALLDEAGDAATAAREVRALMFIARFAKDVDARQEQLGQ